MKGSSIGIINRMVLFKFIMVKIPLEFHVNNYRSIVILKDIDKMLDINSYEQF